MAARPKRKRRVGRRARKSVIYHGRPVNRCSVPDLNLLRKIGYAEIVPKVRKTGSRLVRIVSRKVRVLTQTLAAAPPLRMRAESFHLAKHGKRIEDCHFIYGTSTIGVADGVGGFRRKGIDPGEYAEELMLNSLAAVVHDAAAGVVDPTEILEQAHSQTTKPGGSNACIITLAGQELWFANVGDSGFKVLRGNTVAYESPAGQLKFNTPAKLSARKPPVPFEGRVRVEAGDFVVAGTDGLFDNLHNWEIQRIVESREFGINCNQELARTIALTAFKNSIDETYSSPFEDQCRQQGVSVRGGKQDDITVVVARIESSSAPDD